MIEIYFIIGIGIICLLSLIYLYKYLIIRDNNDINTIKLLVKLQLFRIQ